ncbi:hypothetical protein FQN54_006457 [Arachnomyces sp. PD_36]|nr:hypothetical protein FQN54_006457 [Arachnomyces sp. PD_36]
MADTTNTRRDMKVKQRSCDGKRPGCTQCVFTGRTCDGYESEWKFISQNSGLASSSDVELDKGQVTHRNEAHAAPRITTAPGDRPYPSLDSSTRDGLVRLLVTAYVPEAEMPYMSDNSDNKQSRICGAWVEALPELSSQTDPDGSLSAAIQAFASSVSHHRPQQEGENLDCTKSYHMAIKALREDLDSPKHPFHAESAAAIMCLSLTELMFSDSAFGLSAHVKGVAQLIQANGPDRYKSGMFHKLFVGFRPLLITKACQARQGTFLALEEWTHIPFSTFKPSIMQSLLSQIAIIPGLLQRSDRLLDPHCEGTDSEARTVFGTFIATLSSLEQWEIALRRNSSTPCYWTCTRDSRSLGSLLGKCNDAIWFPNVTMANVYTHLWTFRILCVAELDKIVTRFPCLVFEDSILSDYFQPTLILEEKVKLSRKICSSMEYLMQDEMKLFGPASTFFPLQTAYQIFTRNEFQQRDDRFRIESIVARLVEKGLRLAPVIVFGERASPN